MKNLKKLTRTMKEIIAKYGLNPSEWGLVWGSNDVIKIQHRTTGEIKYLDM